MSLDLEHRGDHAVITFSGELLVPAVLELVGLIDGVLATYFYPRIELILSSNGGVIQSANPFFSALPRWRAVGVTLCTRVYSHAGSLAAILFAVGDDRAADPNARLFFHAARVQEAHEITALDTLRMHAVLTQLDDRLVHLLVDRAVRGGPVVVPAVDHPSDRPLVSSLLRELSLGGRARSDTARVRVLAHHVERAVRKRDRTALELLYRSVLRKEASLSPHLACTLCLADRLLAPEAPSVECDSAGEAEAPALVIPEWRALYPPEGAVPREAITKHALITGETGSGKTLSGILPIVAAMARAPREQCAGALIVDPKCELAPILRALAGDALQLLDPQRVVLNLMSGPRWRLEEDLAAKRWITVAVKIMLRMRGFALASPLRVLGPHEPGSSNSEFFDREGCQLLRDLIAFILMLIDPEASPTSEWLPRPDADTYTDIDPDSDADVCDVEKASVTPTSLAATIVRKRSPPSHPTGPREWVEALLARARGTDSERGLNIVALGAWALGTAIAQSKDDDDSDWLWARLARAALPAFGAEPGEARDLLERVLGYWLKSAMVDRQHMGVVASARSATHEFAAPSAQRTLYFGCEPGLSGPGAGVDFARLVACAPPDHTHPRFVLYQPARDGGDSLVAAALKARFFESVFADDDRKTGRPNLPLIGYVADEAHKFITSDAVHGEQSFLDSARSFGCFSVLATQGLASIEHALAQGGGSSVERRAAMAIVATNTGAKLHFRTTDESTCEMVQQLAPHRPGYAPVVRVRPLSALPPGACYAFLPDGKFTLAQLSPFDPDAASLTRCEPNTEGLAAAPGVDEPSRRSRRKRRRGWSPRSRPRRKPHDGRAGPSESRS